MNKPIPVSTELYKDIEADLEQVYQERLSHWDRIWQDGKPGGYEAVIERFDLVCELYDEADTLRVALVNKESGDVFWEAGYEYLGYSPSQ